MSNNDVHDGNASDAEPYNDTLPNQHPSERLADFNEIIRTFRTLSTEKKHEYTRLYIEICWKNPLSHVTLDQHTEAFKQIGVSMPQPQHPPSNFSQGTGLCTDGTSTTEGDEQKAKEFQFKVPKKVGEQKTKEFEFKVPFTNQLKQRRENNVCEVNESIDSHTKSPDVEAKVPNSRMTRRRCTTYFNK